jgi:4-diphosphocytidyl-2-C-methyl-D-erythritol kinase
VDREIAYAKINLALHVRGRRDDGYHDLETLFAFCADGDVVEAEAADTLSLTIAGPFAEGLSVTDNLVIRAAQALAPGRGAAIQLTKNLPVASGIGGGSADAAATLRLLSRMWGINADLRAIAASLGADLPACLTSKTARGEGRGDDLMSVDLRIAGTPVLLVNPRMPLSTASVFKAWDGNDRGALGDWRAGRNDLEPPACALVPAIGEILDWLRRFPNVTLARMSGSGATCFALFDNVEACDLAAFAGSRDRPDWWFMASTLR